MYSFDEPVTTAPCAVCPLTAYITSPSGAALNALLTVTELALKEEIAFVSTLWFSDQFTCTNAPASSFS